MNKYTIKNLLERAAEALKFACGIDWTAMHGWDGTSAKEMYQELLDAAQEVEHMPEVKYKIVRHFRNSNRKLVIKRNLPLSLAQEHCNSPETSSSTCTKPENKRRTRRYGPWFDGYTQE